MTNISIVYFSGTGPTAKMAEAVAKGVSALAEAAARWKRGAA